MNPSMLWLSGALFTWGLGESMFLVFQPIYLQQLGADPIRIGFILSVFGIAMAVAPIPAGYLSDRFGRRSMLIVGWAIGLVAALMMALATGLLMFVVGLCIYGTTAFVVSPLDSYSTAARGKWSVARAITALSMAYNGGAVIGSFIGGVLADRFGLRSVYFAATGVFVLSTAFMFLIAPQPPVRHDPENPPPSLLRNRGYLGFLAIYFVVAFATYVPLPFTPNLLHNQRGLSLLLIGQLGSIGDLGNTLMNWLLGRMEARTGFLLGQLGVAAFALLLWQATGFGWLALGYLLLGGYRALRMLGVAQIRPAFIALLGRRRPPDFAHEAEFAGFVGDLREERCLPKVVLVDIKLVHSRD